MKRNTLIFIFLIIMTKPVLANDPSENSIRHRCANAIKPYENTIVVSICSFFLFASNYLSCTLEKEPAICNRTIWPEATLYVVFDAGVLAYDEILKRRAQRARNVAKDNLATPE